MDKKKILIIVVAVLVILVAYLVISTNNSKVTINSSNETTNNVQQSDNSNTNNESAVEQSNGITINKSEITSVAKFYKYKSGNIDMEVMAVKASDGTIRTALNTCQVCYDSGRGYYKQQGNYLVCQNCGNRFNIDQIEKIKGGCNPVPVLEADKTDNGETITISSTYLDSQKSYFENWK